MVGHQVEGSRVPQEGDSGPGSIIVRCRRTSMGQMAALTAARHKSDRKTDRIEERMTTKGERMKAQERRLGGGWAVAGRVAGIDDGELERSSSSCGCHCSG